MSQAMEVNAFREDDTLPPVEIVASHYQWACPTKDCGHTNRVYEVAIAVKCAQCHTLYRVTRAWHAVNW